MTNGEKLIKMKEIREEIKKLKNEITQKTAEGDKLMGEFLGVKEGTNFDMIDLLETVYNKVHD